MRAFYFYNKKLCKCCGVEQPLSAFAKNKAKADGLQYRCKDCWAKYRKENKEKILEQKRKHYAKNKERLLEEKKQIYLINAEKKKEYQRNYYWKNVEAAKNRHKKFYKNNPTYYVEFRKKYPAKVNAKENKRKAAKLQRTPKWLTDDDYWMIEQAYELAALRTKMFGFPWHVDHKIPLQGKLVSGLHVPTNLQVIPGSENCAKRNKFEV